MPDPREMADALAVHPGETLLIRVSTPMNDEEVAEFKERFRAAVADVEPVIIIADQMLVYRPGETNA